MNSESSQEMGQQIRLLGLQSGREQRGVRKRAQTQKEARREPVLPWRDLPWEVFKVEGTSDTKGKYGPSRILTLERKGERIKVWACSRLIEEMDGIPRKRWEDLQIVNHGMKRAKKSGCLCFDFEVV